MVDSDECKLFTEGVAMPCFRERGRGPHLGYQDGNWGRLAIALLKILLWVVGSDFSLCRVIC